MRGGYVHNRVLLEPIAQTALDLGMKVDCEISIVVGERTVYGDLFIQSASRRILVEAEMSSKRITNDLEKAVALKVCELWLVVPNPRVAQSVRRKIAQQPVVLGKHALFVLLLPQALQRLREYCDLFSEANARSEKKSDRKEGW